MDVAQKPYTPPPLSYTFPEYHHPEASILTAPWRGKVQGLGVEKGRWSFTEGP